MIDLLLAGGPFMFATLAVSLVTVAIFFARATFLWGKNRVRRALLPQVLTHTQAANYAEAIRVVSTSAAPLSKVLKAALLRADRSEREIRRAVESAALEEIPKVRGGTVFLPQLSNLATLFGLIGTIHGLIIAFQGAGAENAATRQTMLSQGIAIAFYNTFFGLVVATLGVVLYLMLMAKTNSTLAHMEQAASTVVDSILWHRGGGGGGGGAGRRE